MLISYVEGKFPEEYVPTVFGKAEAITFCEIILLQFFCLILLENYEKEVECDGKHINFTLWDTAGQEGWHQKLLTSSKFDHISPKDTKRFEH